MTNGFYDTSSINTKAKKKAFILDAIQHSYITNIQVKYKGKSNSREIEYESSIGEFIEILLSQGKKAKLDCINRNDYYNNKIQDQDGEVSFHWIGDKNNYYWRLLYCFMNLDNLKKLTTKYNLKLKEW
jgi:hypothetical protein